MSSSTSGSAAPSGSSEAFHQPPLIEQATLAAASANSSMGGSGAADSDPCQERHPSDFASHTDSAAPVPATARHAGDDAGLTAALSLIHLTKPSTQGAAGAADKGIPLAHVNSSAAVAAEASSSAACLSPNEGLQLANGLGPFPASRATGSSNKGLAAASSSSSSSSRNQSHSNISYNSSKIVTQVCI